MRKIHYTKQFDKDIKKKSKSGKDLTPLKAVIRKIVNGERLEAKYKEHCLTGNYKNRWECHIEPDWLLIYKLEKDRVTFERTGSHSDLFR